MSPEGHWEKNLSKPPVPNLRDTLEKYLAHLKVILPASQYEQTQKLVEQFEQGIGRQLQHQLIQWAEKSENWVNDFWLDDMYLNNPLPLPVNSSPFCLFPRQTFRSPIDLFHYAARIVKFTLSFKEQIDRESLSQEYGTGLSKGEPLCMSTYRNFFTVTRVPGTQGDKHVRNEPKPPAVETVNHIIVASRNQFYKVTLGKGYQVDETRLANQLKLIWYSSRDKEASFTPIGLLTTENRKVWAGLRTHLLTKTKNAESIEAIESSLFILCLDDSVFGRNVSSAASRRDSIEMARMETSFMASQLMHGGGTEYFSANRYYDKFLQIIVSRDGLAGLVFEHSASEGITVIRYIESLLGYLDSLLIHTEPDLVTCKESIKLHNSESILKSTNNSEDWKLIGRLTWDVDETVLTAIKEAAKKVNRLVNDVDLCDAHFNVFGKSFIKSQSMSPDAFIQLSLQLTHYKVHRRLVSTYESASLRKFRAGRVDNSRSNTIEVLAWCKALCNEIPNLTEQHKLDLFQLAIKKQVEIAKYTVNGHGPDNHLLALRELAKGLEEGKPCPGIELFKEKSYKEYLNFKLSTSQLTYSKCLLIGYGAVTPEGYGIAYRLTENGITFCISSFLSSPETGSQYFASSLEGSLLQMRELCLKLRSPEEAINMVPIVSNKPTSPMNPTESNDKSIESKQAMVNGGDQKQPPDALPKESPKAQINGENQNDQLVHKTEMETKPVNGETRVNSDTIATEVKGSAKETKETVKSEVVNGPSKELID